MSVETVEQPSSRRTSYPIYIHNVGGKEPDGKPTRIGKWTFATKMVRDVVLDNVHGRVLNACAGETKLEKRGCEFVRNDLNPEVDADTHVDVRSIDEAFRRDEFDSAINDPPFDAGRAAKLYEGFHAKGYMEAREAIAPLVRRVEPTSNSVGTVGDWPTLMDGSGRPTTSTASRSRPTFIWSSIDDSISRNSPTAASPVVMKSEVTSNGWLRL